MMKRPLVTQISHRETRVGLWTPAGSMLVSRYGQRDLSLPHLFQQYLEDTTKQGWRKVGAKTSLSMLYDSKEPFLNGL